MPADKLKIVRNRDEAKAAEQREILAALKDCQRVLAELGRPSVPGPSVPTIWAQCIAAEARARQAILRAEDGQ